MEITARNITAWLVAKLLILLGVTWYTAKKALKREYILSIYFHNPSKEEFELFIKWLKRKKFTFLSTADLECIILGGLTFPKGAVLLTVDDGWQSNEKNIVAIANEYCIPVTIFISTAAVEDGVFWWSYWEDSHSAILKSKQSLEAVKKVSNTERLLKLGERKKAILLKRNALTVEQVKNAFKSKYITIGSHSHTHPILINCNENEVRSELTMSKQKLESWIGKEVKYFAYPNGDYNQREIQILKELKYSLAFNVQPTYIIPDRLKDPYSLPRFSFVEGASFEENICRFLGVWKFSRIWLKLAIFKIKRAINTFYLEAKPVLLQL